MPALNDYDVERVFDKLDVTNLVKIEKALQDHPRGPVLRQYLAHRYRRLVATFVNDHEVLTDTLQLCRAVVGDISAIGFSCENSSAEKLNIYTPASKAVGMRAYIENEGYELIKSVTFSEHAGHVYQELLGKYVYARDAKTINVLVSRTESVLTCILSGKTTASMCFFNGRIFWAAYQVCFSKKQCYINPLMLNGTPVGSSSAQAQNHVAAARDDLEGTGFGVGINADYVLPSHICGEDPICPHTTRSTTDEFCCRISLSTETQPGQELVREGFRLRWRLGGPPCREGGPTSERFIEIVPAFVAQ